MLDDTFLELIHQFSGYCVPADACEFKKTCWTHSWWEGEETFLEGFALIAVKMRQDPNWWNVKQFEGDVRRCSVPAHVKVETGTEPAGSWFQISNGATRSWTSCSGELTR